MIIGVYGRQDSGKTTLVEELVSALVAKGYRVASVKHTPHDKSLDSEGKDTWRHWKAGSDPVVFSSSTETALIKHSRSTPEEIARLLLAEYHPDVIVFEGCKEGKFPKVGVGKVQRRKGTIMTNPPLEKLLAYVEHEVAVERTLERLPRLDCGKCGLECAGLAEAVADGKKSIEDCVELSPINVEILVGGKRIPTGRFVSRIVADTVRGMLSSLKGYQPGKDVEIRLRAAKLGARSVRPKRAR